MKQNEKNPDHMSDFKLFEHDMTNETMAISLQLCKFAEEASAEIEAAIRAMESTDSTPTEWINLLIRIHNQVNNFHISRLHFDLIKGLYLKSESSFKNHNRDIWEWLKGCQSLYYSLQKELLDNYEIHKERQGDVMATYGEAKGHRFWKAINRLRQLSQMTDRFVRYHVNPAIRFINECNEKE